MQIRCEFNPDSIGCSYYLCEPLKETFSESLNDLSRACKKQQMKALHFASFFMSQELDEAALSLQDLSYYRAHIAIAFGGRHCPRSMRHQLPCLWSTSCCDLRYKAHFFDQKIGE